MNKKIQYALATLCLGLVATACSTDTGGSFANGIGDNAHNAVYMGNANSSGVLSVVASDAEGASFTVTPRLARLADCPVEVTLEVDAEALSEYNRLNNLSTLPIKAEDVVFTDAQGVEHVGKITVTIAKGEISTAVPARLTSLSAEKYPYGGRYAIPVKITNVSEGNRLLSAPRTTIVSLNRKIKTSVMHLTRTTTSGYTMHFTPKTPIEEEMSEWTLQYIAQFSLINGNNQTTASLRGSMGFYNRISQTGGLQIKSEGRDGTDTWTNKPIKQGEWLHVSYVYRKQGLVGQLSVYVNGELQKTFTTSLLSPKGAEGGWGFGNSNVNNYYLREFRFWNRALSAAEIVDKYYLPESTDSPGLVAYFPLTKESYDTTTNAYLDLMGNWTWTLNSPATTAIVENVVFPATALTIEE